MRNLIVSPPWAGQVPLVTVVSTSHLTCLTEIHTTVPAAPLRASSGLERIDYNQRTHLLEIPLVFCHNDPNVLLQH